MISAFLGAAGSSRVVREVRDVKVGPCLHLVLAQFGHAAHGRMPPSQTGDEYPHFLPFENHHCRELIVDARRSLALSFPLTFILFADRSNHSFPASPFVTHLLTSLPSSYSFILAKPLSQLHLFPPQILSLRININISTVNMRSTSVLAALLASAPGLALASGYLGFALGSKQPGGQCKYQADYEADFRAIRDASGSSIVRIYAADQCNTAQYILPAAKKEKFQVILGIW